jgi:hypothetical protein
MSDPARWLASDGGASDLEREVLGEGLDVDPPPQAQAAVWAALTVSLLPHGGAAGGGGAAPQAAGAAGASVVKGGATAVGVAKAFGTSAAIKGALWLVGGAAVVAGAVALRAPKASSVAPAVQAPIAQPAIEAKPESAPTTPEPAVEAPAPQAQEAENLAVVPPPAASQPAPAASERASRLREESAMLAQARDALHGGDPTGALRILDAARVKFANGVLNQEREALAIEALARSNKTKAASQRAAAFLRAYPTSPHAAHVRTFLK